MRTDETSKTSRSTWSQGAPRLALGLVSAVLIGACATTSSDPVANADPYADEPEARRIVDAMAATYANATTYRDTGESFHDVMTIHGGQMNRFRFTTAFLRPDSFRFAWVVRFGDDPPIPAIAWSSGGAARLRIANENPQEYASAGRVATAAVQPSAGDASRVPRLLMPDEATGPSLVEDLYAFRMVGEEDVDGHRCHIVRGEHSTAGEQRMWIDADSHLLRKFEYVRKLRGFDVKTTVFYDPQIDVLVDASDFVYELPAIELNLPPMRDGVKLDRQPGDPIGLPEDDLDG